MANNYESLKTDGHYTLAYRIFLKLRSWIIDFVKLERPNDPTAYTVSSEDGSVDLSGSSSSSVAYTDEYGIRHVAASSNFDLSVQEVNGHTVNSDVPANAEFTDEKVKQTPSTANSDFEVLLSGTADNVEHTEEANKNDGLTFNPSTGNLQTTQLNGVTVGSSPVFTDIKVTQTNTTDSSNYRLLLSGNATDTTQTTTTRKSAKFTANPSTGNLNITQLNGVTVGSSPKFTDTTYTAGENVTINNNVISSDQIEDSYDYEDYEDLPDSVKMMDKIFMVSNAPIQKFAEYDQATKTVSFKNGFASYNETTKTVRIGG